MLMGASLGNVGCRFRFPTQRDFWHLYQIPIGPREIGGETVIRALLLTGGHLFRLDWPIKGTMNSLFLKDLAAKTRRGLWGRVERGGNSFGYDVVTTLAADGTPSATNDARLSLGRTRATPFSGRSYCNEWKLFNIFHIPKIALI